MDRRLLLLQRRHLKFHIEWEKEKLIPNLYLVRKKVKATNKTERVINDAVFKWLNDAEKLIEEMENLEMSYMPTIEREHELCEEIMEKITTLNNSGEFEPFSSPIPGLEYFSSRNFKCFEPTKEASDQLLEALQDDSTHIIGLYWRHGSGKTTLVKAVGEKVKYLKIFDAVLFATVSQNPNVKMIQDQFANSLNLRLDKNTEAARAIKIYSKLERMDCILVILDDVREMLDPEDFGIPCNGKYRCKVLFTTRRHLQECTTPMESQIREIPLHPISKEEAWALLKRQSGINDESSSDLLNVAHKVANECEGLLGTIKDVGSSLKGKSIEEWEASLNSLRHSMARYQVFLSFRGEDTRNSFTSSLYHALCQRGFKTFMDEEGLRNGDQISPSLIKAIEASRLSIIVLSENYACSSWCLDELVKILECMKMNNQLVWPIFYKVEPSDIRHQTNSYGKAMAKHENRVGSDYEKVKKWRLALFEVSNLSGKSYKIGYEYKFIEKIVEDANNIKNHLYIRSMDMDYK